MRLTEGATSITHIYANQMPCEDCAIAQMERHGTGKPKVRGSTPATDKYTLPHSSVKISV